MNNPIKPSATARSAQHSQAAYDIWSLTKIQAARNDPRPSIDGEVVMKRLVARLESRHVSSSGEDPSDVDDDPSLTTVEVEDKLRTRQMITCQSNQTASWSTLP